MRYINLIELNWIIKSIKFQSVGTKCVSNFLASLTLKPAGFLLNSVEVSRWMDQNVKQKMLSFSWDTRFYFDSDDMDHFFSFYFIRQQLVFTQSCGDVSSFCGPSLACKQALDLRCLSLWEKCAWRLQNLAHCALWSSTEARRFFCFPKYCCCGNWHHKTSNQTKTPHTVSVTGIVQGWCWDFK